MTKRMLIDATHAEETRVVVLDGSRLEDFDVETSTKRQLKGNIYLAKVVRVEPSLQAAFVEYGGNRHGFLAFGEIHPDYYQIPVADRQRLIEHAGRGGPSRGGRGRPRRGSKPRANRPRRSSRSPKPNRRTQSRDEAPELALGAAGAGCGRAGGCIRRRSPRRSPARSIAAPVEALRTGRGAGRSPSGRTGAGADRRRRSTLQEAEGPAEAIAERRR